MIEIVCGDVSEVLPDYPENTFDACFCDPPYGLSFMGKAWDHGVPSAEVWRGVYRVLKPGAVLAAFGGTRTWHRLACAIEDAGFEIRDTLMWLYGSGFPKSLDISKAIDKAAGVKRTVVIREGVGYEAAPDANTYAHGLNAGFKPRELRAPATDAARQWSGYGTALKPAWEPIILAMKPCEGTYAENALKWGVAGLAVDAGRIGATRDVPASLSKCKTPNSIYGKYGGGAEKELNPNLGRWPANLLLSCACDGEHGLDCPVRMLDEQSGERGGWYGKDTTARGRVGAIFGGASNESRRKEYMDSGGASRFFYCAKASRRERGTGNTHPTVKPLSVCRYLASLLLPPDSGSPRVLLNPFSGSGSEAIGADRAGWDLVVSVEISPEYAEIARRRSS